MRYTPPFRYPPELPTPRGPDYPLFAGLALIVTTQSELNKAVADKVDWIEIHSPAGVLIEVTAYGSSTVTACGSVAVHLHSATVKLSELRPITGATAKCKAPKVVRACVEVDVDGVEIRA